MLGVIAESDSILPYGGQVCDSLRPRDYQRLQASLRFLLRLQAALQYVAGSLLQIYGAARLQNHGETDSSKSQLCRQIRVYEMLKFLHVKFLPVYNGFFSIQTFGRAINRSQNHLLLSGIYDCYLTITGNLAWLNCIQQIE